MKIFWRGIATVLFYVISGALLIYAAARSMNFIVSTLPADQQLTGYLALAATSGGMISWLLTFLYKAEGLGQKITAALMVGVDLLGEFALFTFDTLYETGKSGMTAALLPEEVKTVVLGLSGLIALNILATVAFHLLDPENMKGMRESFVRDNLENNALALIEKQGDELARTMAPALAEQWAADFQARFSDLGSLGLGKVNRQPAPQAAPAQQATRGPVALARQLFKRPVKVGAPAQAASEPERLTAETVALPELAPLAKSDGHPNGPEGGAK